MTRSICFLNQKGGVGKTTSAINLGAAFARKHKKKVLLIDLDPQCSLTKATIGNEVDVKATIYDVMTGQKPIHDAIVHYTVFDVLPSSQDVAQLEIELATKSDRERILAKALKEVENEYDFIHVDCPPSLNILSINALFACGEVIIPLQAEPLAAEGLAAMLSIVAEVELLKKQSQEGIRILGALLTNYKRSLVLTKQVEPLIEEQLPGLIFKTRIRDNISIPEAQGYGFDIIEYKRISPGAADYEALAKEILQKDRRGKNHG